MPIKNPKVGYSWTQPQEGRWCNYTITHVEHNEQDELVVRCDVYDTLRPDSLWYRWLFVS